MTNSKDSRLTVTEPDLSVARRRNTLRSDDRKSDDRQSQDRKVTEARGLSDADRLEMFRQQMFDSALPDLPEIPGFHVCWLTTTNSRDPIHRREMWGYTPIMASEVPGMEHASIKTGEYAGLIGINEMLAFKLPLHLYHEMMQAVHHDAPRREEEKLSEMADSMRDQAARSGTALIEGDGMTDMRESAPSRGIF
jgi:hypothetical protein